MIILILIIWNVLLSGGIIYLLYHAQILRWIPGLYIDRDGLWIGYWYRYGAEYWNIKWLLWGWWRERKNKIK